MPSKKGRDVFYATGFVVSRPHLKLDVIKNIYVYIYIYILYKKNKPKIKKHRYMKYFGYILTFINHTVH